MKNYLWLMVLSVLSLITLYTDYAYWASVPLVVWIIMQMVLLVVGIRMLLVAMYDADFGKDALVGFNQQLAKKKLSLNGFYYTASGAGHSFVVYVLYNATSVAITILSVLYAMLLVTWLIMLYNFRRKYNQHEDKS